MLVEFWRRGIQGALYLKCVGNDFSFAWIVVQKNATLHDIESLKRLVTEWLDVFLGISRVGPSFGNDSIWAGVFSHESGKLDAEMEVVLITDLGKGCFPELMWRETERGLNWDALLVVDLISTVRWDTTVSTPWDVWSFSVWNVVSFQEGMTGAESLSSHCPEVIMFWASATPIMVASWSRKRTEKQKTEVDSEVSGYEDFHDIKTVFPYFLKPCVAVRFLDCQTLSNGGAGQSPPIWISLTAIPNDVFRV